MVERESSETHHIAVVKLDNGELVEDIVKREMVEETAEDGTPKASEPSRPRADADYHAKARIVESHPAPVIPNRPHPEAPLPGTIPRETPPD